MDTKQPLIGQTPTSTEPVREDPATLQRQIAYYTHVQRCASIRRERAEELMQRPVAKSWDAAKKAKMVRKLMASKQEFDQSVSALDQLNFRLQQVTNGQGTSGPVTNTP